MSNKIQVRFGIITLMIGAAALSRLLPHPYNFTPIGAIGLFGGAYFSKKYLSFLIPFAALWASDFLLNNLVYARLYPQFYQEGVVWFSQLAIGVYLGFGLIIALGIFILRKVNIPNLLAASLLASVIFFLVTNFGSWLVDPVYPKTATGLLGAYAAGLPFFWNTLLGDLFFAGVLFGAYEWAQRRMPALRTSTSAL
ncbi:MAG: hypothetical protein KDD02_03125 [Phaeodactylibacter sp.]|nr:hypothetical protein [Phaeodactylibacter sp.]MCB9303375.1 hypothetical protein [Lewinellaceae bacterium]HQU58403.1 hypothetical protein [Saprospiraceae bacterium]